MVRKGVNAPVKPSQAMMRILELEILRGGENAGRGGVEQSQLEALDHV